MLRYLPLLLVLAVTLYCLIDCVQTPSAEVRTLPKAAWVVLLLLFGLLASVGWLVAGRPHAGTAGGPATGPRRPPSGPPSPWSRRSTGGSTGRPLAPDDDPEFLRRLGRNLPRPGQPGQPRADPPDTSPPDRHAPEQHARDQRTPEHPAPDQQRAGDGEPETGTEDPTTS